MSVTVKIGDRNFAVAVPYKLRQMEAAAPFIDAINEKARADKAAKAAAERDGEELPEPALAELYQSFRNILGAILPGIVKADPAVTLDMLIDEFDPAEWQELKSAFDNIFNKSGLASSGEALAPAPADPAEA